MVLLVRLGAGSLFFLNALSFVSMIVALRSLPPLPEHRKPVGRLTNTGLPPALGPRPVVLLLAVAALVAICGRSYPQLLPVFANDVWHVGAPGYGALLAAGGAGALLGGVGTAAMPQLRATANVVFGAGIVLALSLVLLGSLRRIDLGIAALVAAGASATVLTATLGTLLQSVVTPERRGRVMSLFVVTLIGLPQLAAPVIVSAARGSLLGVGQAIIAAAILLALGITMYRGLTGQQQNKQNALRHWLRGLAKHIVD